MAGRSERRWSTEYGEEKASLMACALTRDDPVTACSDTEALVDEVRDNADDGSGGWSEATLLVGLGLGLCVGAAALVLRRRRRT